MKSTDPELVFTRIVDAPREQVFEAWTDPVQPRRHAEPKRRSDDRDAHVQTGSGTRYTARVRHWPVGEEEANETMGLELR